MDESLRRFYQEFRPDVPDCPINEFLNFASHCPKARPILDRGPTVRVTGSRKKGFADLLSRFQTYEAGGQHVTCKECSRIGDVVIVLDMPKSFVLLHTDYSFDYLCECMGIDHYRLETLLATSPEREVLAALREE